ncbi:SO2930 family diheme c-type cytochrome [Shewanella acanthi]|uniref:SO2930 family diheme c-type cytochrome n=1 Tax=Shewanella acanthi TaxID=2864212 RepID=UPI001C657A50|nr:SO2930 family diheme c-type cytochrome [Shewanella acanthi]QYJ80565.1 hypothetical protein K0H61_06555 [Shewanella acanthi]
MQNRLLTSLVIIFCSQLLACGGGESDTTPPPTTPTTPTVPTTPTTPESACDAQSSEVNWQALMTEDCPRLSQYHLFTDPSNPTTAPQAPGFGYQLASQLFTNYSTKYRFIFLPQGTAMHYQPQQAFDFPEGAVLVKTFALPLDTALTSTAIGASFDTANETLIETRLLIKRAQGWTSLTYQWPLSTNKEASNGESLNKEASGDATLLTAGATVTHTLTNQGQTQTFEYNIPSRAECKVCHQYNQGDSSLIIPIGLKAYLLNRDIPVEGSVESVSTNQLSLWRDRGQLLGLPDLSTVGKTYPINDASADLTARAKGYLDVNCAHCHNPNGYASISGLRLGFYVDHTTYPYGICKQPPGWDGGPRGLNYDIVPGNADHSILLYRQTLSEPKDRMPPIGRALEHQEGVELIGLWIDSLSPSLGSCI